MANFAATPTGGCGSLTIDFVDLSSGNGRTITGWSWDFGDNTTYSGQTPLSHAYAGAGTYTVKLVVTSTCGTNTKIAHVVVSSLPVVDPGTYRPVCVTGDNITLSGTPVGGTWSGDGVSGNTFAPATAGLGGHILTYHYTDNNECTVSKTTALTVVPLPLTTITVG
jgi:PKD repeat protein